MSIKAIDKIPDKSASVNEKVKADLYKALENRVSLFEIFGEYNMKYLREKVKYQAAIIFRKDYFAKIMPEVEKNACADYYEQEGKHIHLYATDYSGRFCTVISRTINGEIHVYVNIDFEFIDNLYDILLEDYRKKVNK